MDVLCVDFINSEFRDFRGRWVRDDLQQPRWLEQFLVKWGLQVDRPPDAATLTTLVALRTLLRSIIEALVEGQLADHDQAALNAVLLKMPLSRRLVKDTAGYRLELVPLKHDWNCVLAEVVASFAHLLAYQVLWRLNMCANPITRLILNE